MKLSARNQLTGKIVEIKKGKLMAQVKIDVGGQFLTAAITLDSVTELGLKKGLEVAAIIKSTSVMIGVEE